MVSISGVMNTMQHWKMYQGSSFSIAVREMSSRKSVCMACVVSRVAFNLDGWCSGLTVVPYSQDISPNALKGCTCIGVDPEDRLELTDQSYSLDMGSGIEELSTGSWKHAVVWVNNYEPVWARGSELRDQGCCTDAGMYLEAYPKGEEVLVLMLEKEWQCCCF